MLNPISGLVIFEDLVRSSSFLEGLFTLLLFWLLFKLEFVYYFSRFCDLLIVFPSM